MIKIYEYNYDKYLSYRNDDEVIAVRLTKDPATSIEAIEAVINFCKREDENWRNPIVTKIEIDETDMQLVGEAGTCSEFCRYVNTYKCSGFVPNVSQSELYARAVREFEAKAARDAESCLNKLLVALEKELAKLN